MQDIVNSIGAGGGGGRLFGGGGDRRLKPHHQQALKCPRCESLNTKFCYYNNYNLSQPRHFCKSCHRYWTKGGVLRNVPVGGGCRKTKRSKPKSSSAESNSNSSSDSSTLTASTTAPRPSTAGSANSSNSAPTFPDSAFFAFPQSSIPSFNPPSLIGHGSDGRIYAEAESFTSLMTSSEDPYNVVDISVLENRSWDQQWEEQEKMGCSVAEEAGFVDQTARIDVSAELQNRGYNGGVGVGDWQAGGDQVMFDLSGTVDQGYWSQTQWTATTDNDHSLMYLP